MAPKQPAGAEATGGKSETARPVPSPETTSDGAAGIVDATAAHKATPAPTFPISGEVGLGASIAGGTFVLGEQQRAGLDGSLSLLTAYKINPSLQASASLSVNKTLSANVDSDLIRPYDTLFSDLVLRLGFAPKSVGDDGKPAPMPLIGGLVVGFDVNFALPISRASRFATKRLGITPGVSLSRSFLSKMLSLAYKFQYGQNFHRSTNAVVSNAELAQAQGRPGGAELLEGGTELATGLLNTQFSIRNRVTATVSLLNDRLSFAADYLLVNGFKYDDAGTELDEHSSPYAVAGRGRSDSQTGAVSVSYTLDKAETTGVSLDATTVSPPFSADNKTYRFPFFDFRSLSDNYTAVGLTLTRTF